MAVSVPPYLPLRESYVPTHAGLFAVQFAQGDFASSLVTLRAFAKGEVICPIENTLPGVKAYSSVQVLPDELGETHIELNSDLLFVNHSCNPNVAFEVPHGGPWLVRALEPLPAGTIMTFAYFSTEWFMDQPFECLCAEPRCLKLITGARDIPSDVLATYVPRPPLR